MGHLISIIESSQISQSGEAAKYGILKSTNSTASFTTRAYSFSNSCLAIGSNCIP